MLFKLARGDRSVISLLDKSIEDTVVSLVRGVKSFIWLFDKINSYVSWNISIPSKEVKLVFDKSKE